MATAEITSRLVELAFERTVFPGAGLLFDALPSECDSSAFLLAIGPDPRWQAFLRLLENSNFEMQRQYGGCVGLMKPDGFAYYAPAMLIFAMNTDSDTLAESIMMDLTPTAAGVDTFVGRAVNELAAARLRRFTLAQKHAIAGVAEFLSSEYPEDGTLASAWRHWQEWLTEAGAA